MSVADNTNTTPATQEDVQHLHLLFSHLQTQQVETFYKHYQHWQLTQQLAELQKQIAAIEQSSGDNTILMQLTQPSPIALATLTRLQSYGVDDVDLLDSMLERGDTWLDHMLQLLEQCQKLGFINDNYTEWCRHALEGAYDWLDSISEDEVVAAVQPMQEEATQATTSDEAIEALLIQRLTSEEETPEIPASMPEPEQVVGIDSSRPLSATEISEGRDEAVPTNNASLTIPSILSYAAIASEESIQAEEVLPTPISPIHEIPAIDTQRKSRKLGLVSRILSKVWQT